MSGKKWDDNRIKNEFVQDMWSEKYFLTCPIVSSKSHFSVLCYTCKNIYDINIANYFYSGRRCRNCRIGLQWTESLVAQRFTQDEFSLSVDFFEQVSTAQSQIKICCAICLNKYPVTINNYFNIGSRCPFCKRSKMESKIATVLTKIGIIFIEQNRFDTCFNLRSLPFDFYIPELNILIEYQGEQHYKLVNWSGKMSQEEMEYNLQRNQYNDNIKQNWCYHNKIQLFCIPYWDSKNITRIIQEICICP